MNPPGRGAATGAAGLGEGAIDGARTPTATGEGARDACGPVPGAMSSSMLSGGAEMGESVSAAFAVCSPDTTSSGGMGSGAGCVGPGPGVTTTAMPGGANVTLT